MSWFVDNANALYILLGIVAAGFVVAWRFNQRVKFLGIAGGFLVLLGLLWLLTRYVVTDARHLENSVQAMAKAIEEGKVDDLFKHVSKDFQYKTMTRDTLYQAARASMQRHQVKEVRISSFTVDELSREKKKAKTRFRVSAWAAGADQPYIFVTQADFILEGETWKLKTMRFYNPLVNQDQEISLPGL